MYLAHFGLKESPFRITPHTEFFYSGAGRGATLEALLYAIAHDEGIIKVSGEMGSGKTMLCRMLLERVPDKVDTVLISNPALTREEIVHAVADELKFEIDAPRAPLLLRRLQDHLIRLHGGNRRVLLLIDEAHAMPQETLEEIRLLSNLETGHAKLLQIVLFGQPELDRLLDLPQMRQLRERITQSFRLEPLTRTEVEAYVDFRMRAAGYAGPKIFSTAAARRIAKASQGLTRRVNLLADKSLLAAFADDRHDITAWHADRAVRDSEFHRPAARGTVIAAAAAGVAAGVALGLALRQLLSPSLPPAAAIDALPAPAPALAAAAARATPVAATPAARGAAARPGARDQLPAPPPAGALARARFDATQAWLQHAPGDQYSIQLLTAEGHALGAIESLLERAAAKNPDLSDFHLYGVKIDGRQHYRLAYGSYANAGDANRAMRALPADYRQAGPYLRSVDRMRSQNRR